MISCLFMIQHFDNCKVHAFLMALVREVYVLVFFATWAVSEEGDDHRFGKGYFFQPR